MHVHCHGEVKRNYNNLKADVFSALTKILNITEVLDQM